MEKTGFFEEAPNQKSSIRLFSFLLLIFFFVLNVLYFLEPENEITYNFIMFDFMLLIGIFVPKYLQKLAENKFITK